GGQGPGGRRTPHAGSCGGDRAGRGVRPARGEPHRPGPHPRPGMAAAGRPVGGDGPRGAALPRGSRLADPVDRRTAHRGSRRVLRRAGPRRHRAGSTLERMAEFHRPALPGSELFETLPGEIDPAEKSAAGHRIAHLLVRGAHDPADHDLVDRVMHLADTEGLGVIAELWADAPAETVAGALWRLYVLRTWVHRNPRRAALEFSTGRHYAPVQ